MRAPNLVAMRTKDGVATLSDLVRSSLRLRPDRIPIGEVRGAEALDLLKAWGTGHPGGIGTIHAGTALGALRRLEQLIQEAVVTVPRALIAETIDLIAVLSGRGAARRLTELARVEGLGPDGDYRLSPPQPSLPTHKENPHDPMPAHSRIRAAISASQPPRHSRSSAFRSGARRPRRRLLDALGAPLQSDPRIDRGTGRQDRRGDHHHRHRPDARLRRHGGGFRRLIQIVFGLSIAFAASSFFLSFFSFGGGALV
jgi:hypothetical protein